MPQQVQCVGLRHDSSRVQERKSDVKELLHRARQLRLHCGLHVLACGPTLTISCLQSKLESAPHLLESVNL